MFFEPILREAVRFKEGRSSSGRGGETVLALQAILVQSVALRSAGEVLLPEACLKRTGTGSCNLSCSEPITQQKTGKCVTQLRLRTPTKELLSTD